MPAHGPKNWSVSAGRLWEKCPRAFKLKYVDKVYMDRGETPVYWRLGTVAHAALEAAYKQRKRERGIGPMMTDSTWTAAKQAIIVHWAKEKMPAVGNDDGLWDRVHAMVSGTLEAEECDWETIYDVERKLFIQCGMNVIGYADIILEHEPGTLLIRDWKTDSRPRDPEVLRRDRQLGLYTGMLYRMVPDVERVLVSHYQPPIATETKVEISRAKGEEAISWLRAIRDMAHHETEWPTNKAGHCDTCEYQTICPAWATETERDAINSQVDLF